MPHGRADSWGSSPAVRLLAVLPPPHARGPQPPLPLHQAPRLARTGQGPLDRARAPHGALGASSSSRSSAPCRSASGSRSSASSSPSSASTWARRSPRTTRACRSSRRTRRSTSSPSRCSPRGTSPAAGGRPSCSAGSTTRSSTTCSRAWRGRTSRRRARSSREHCATIDVPYAEVPLWRSYQIVIKYLNRVGLAARDPFDCPVVAQYRRV